ncbi:putative signal recognition particle GTPase [Corynebacterium glutamicum MB001]|uniref:Signal recognition particle protein n=2 Tax=Corynebacterium glutamicum TaxID=1718 RepID=Q8NNW9_CORGL|nr:signal recognition particle protein [Corynebacterium glutamicum]AGT05795.1 putative signal recognition particle GTPase [Corynebacterium glutamicum MB001]ARV63890.1 signal recognition particle protein [Corynebacterium glutamicum]ASW14445.1 putative signal recognition particle GTPase [Corynebacterium glutamicum]AUI01520.1 signal recognition particle protein [Corynebacterium glutamicum]AUI05194.1 signal recognition particle protein [Corynebacterium glutamicum]
MFESLSDRLNSALSGLRGKGKLTEADINATTREIRLALLEADVSLTVVRAFINRIKERAVGAEVSQALNPAQQVIKIVNEELVQILGGETRRLSLAKNPPTVIMLAGLQGAGKTTLAGKLSKHLVKQGHTPMLVACDLQRPGAVQQLQIVGERAGVTTFAPDPGTSIDSLEHEMGTSHGDPVEVARAGIEEAKRTQHDIVIVDTAGRLGIDETLMTQARNIREAINPDEVLFVIDSMIGQDAVDTAEAFRDGVDFTGVVLTKLDGDARGGAALSIREVTGKPIMFASTGEKLDDFDVFHPERMASRILGMGDVLSLIEQAEAVMDQEKAEVAAQKLGSGELTLEDFLDQMLMIRRMGPIGNILKMLPGGKQMSQMADMVDEKQLDRIQAIIRGMTPAERDNPKILNASRRKRIANGSGVTVSEVNKLVERFFEARKMMGQMAGQFGMGPGSRSATKKQAKGRKGKNGKRKPAKKGPTQPKMPMGGMPGMPGMPGMGGAGMPDLAELQKQLGGAGGGMGGLGGGLPGMPKPPKGMENIDLNNLDFGKK